MHGVRGRTTRMASWGGHWGFFGFGFGFAFDRFIDQSIDRVDQSPKRRRGLQHPIHTITVCSAARPRGIWIAAPSAPKAKRQTEQKIQLDAGNPTLFGLSKDSAACMPTYLGRRNDAAGVSCASQNARSILLKMMGRQRLSQSSVDLRRASKRKTRAHKCFRHPPCSRVKLSIVLSCFVCRRFSYLFQ